MAQQGSNTRLKFSLEDQRLSSAVSGLIFFGGSEEEVAADDSISLTALDAEKWACSGEDHDTLCV